MLALLLLLLHYNFFDIINSESPIDLRLRLRPPPPPPTAAKSTTTIQIFDSHIDIRLRPPPPTSASDLRLRPPPPTSASDLRTPPPTFASDLLLRLRLHCKHVNAPISGIVGARIAFEGIAISKVLSMMSVIRNFQNLLCSFYVQSDDERNVKLSVQCWPRM